MKVIKDAELRDMLLCRGELHLNATASSSRPEVFVLEAQWGRLKREYRVNLVEGMKQCENEGVQVVHSLMSYGNDEVEDFLLEGLGLTSFPAFLKISVNESKTIISHLTSMQWKVLNTEEKVFSPYIVADYEKNLVEKIFEGDDVGLLFVSGDRSGVGKTSCCLGLLNYLTETCGISPDQLGYIKPVTQCEAEQPLVRYCGAKDIECVGIGPVVFYKGFTRAFLAGETASSQELVSEAVRAVMNMKKRRKFVLVDGVGYPAVGSICGISNAHIAAALNAPVLIIGKSGVGDAVDSHNLNSTFFEHHNVSVLGALFNKMATSGYYDIENCSTSIDSYFEQYRRNQMVFGYLPKLNLECVDSNMEVLSDAETLLGRVLGDAFKDKRSRVQVPSLMRAILIHQKVLRNGSDLQSFVHDLMSRPAHISGGSAYPARRDQQPHGAYENSMEIDEGLNVSSRKRKADTISGNGFLHSTVRERVPREAPHGTLINGATARYTSRGPGKSRVEIEAEAKSKGARGG